MVNSQPDGDPNPRHRERTHGSIERRRVYHDDRRDRLYREVAVFSDGCRAHCAARGRIEVHSRCCKTYESD